MYDNYNYPAGADTPDAPWNEVEVPEKDFDVTISQSLSRDITVTTNNYVPGASGVDYEPDDEGGYCACGWQDSDDTSDTDWAEVYKENGHLTPLQLIERFHAILKVEQKNVERRQAKKFSPIRKMKLGFIKHLIAECEGWTNDETEFLVES